MITKAIQYFLKAYDESPYQINCGLCEEFATDVLKRLGHPYKDETDERCMLWHDNMPDCTEEEAAHWSHCFIKWDGKFYDSECPEGVTEWRKLPIFVNNPL